MDSFPVKNCPDYCILKLVAKTGVARGTCFTGAYLGGNECRKPSRCVEAIERFEDVVNSNGSSASVRSLESWIGSASQNKNCAVAIAGGPIVSAARNAVAALDSLPPQKIDAGPQNLKAIALSRPFGYNVSFKTAAKGLYVVAENGGSGIIGASRSAVGPWETFRLVDLNGGSLTSGDVVNLASDQGTYVVAENGGGGTLSVNRPNAGTWEEITVLKVNGSGAINSGDVVVLRTKNGQFIVAEDGGGGRVNANRTAIGPWEQFIIEFR